MKIVARAVGVMSRRATLTLTLSLKGEGMEGALTFSLKGGGMEG
jgi:hypothetical protein